MRDQIHRLHTIYAHITGHSVTLDAARERDWYDWLKRIAAIQPAIHPEAALHLVVGKIQRGIREQKRNPGALKFRNLIGQPDYFEEDLAEARAQARRGPTDHPRAEVLRATGRPSAEPSREPRTPAQIMEADRAFEEFRKLKETI